MYIRRDRSNLHFGRQSRRRGSGVLMIAWLAVMLVMVGIIWQFNSVQTWVLAGVGSQPTATLDPVTLAQMGERAYLGGDIELAITRYGEAARLRPDDMAIQFEYGRMLLYRSYAGRSYRDRAVLALEVAQQAVERSPNDGRAQALLCYALVENGRIILDQGGQRIAPDAVYQVFAAGTEVVDPVSGRSLGKTEDKIADVKITQVLPKFSYAQVVTGNASAVQIGQVCRVDAETLTVQEPVVGGKKSNVQFTPSGGVRMPFDN